MIFYYEYFNCTKTLDKFSKMINNVLYIKQDYYCLPVAGVVVPGPDVSVCEVAIVVAAFVLAVEPACLKKSKTTTC